VKILKCDQCKSTGKDVKTYTHGNKFMSLKIDFPNIFSSSGSCVQMPVEKEFCDNCAANIHASYKHFLEEYVP
jgi:hypothetical protein